MDLHPGTTRDDVVRLLRVLTEDAARLTGGRGPLADSEPELAAVPASLTVTVGLGPGLVRAAGREVPDWLAPLPAFDIDRLDPAWCDGDLLPQVAADDPLTVSHASRMLVTGTRSFGTLRWEQRGFRRAHGSEKPGTTMRNLFGQVDGSANPALGSRRFAEVVWIPDGPFAGGTSMVLRRIAMDLDRWDEADRPAREAAIGRRLDTGAPLTGTGEFDEPDVAAVGPRGFPVIPEFSHMRRARGEGERPAQEIYRRGYNYEDGGAAGLLFVSFQASVAEQFVPIQHGLAETDLLNVWTTPVGSAVFAVPPGAAEGEFVGERALA